MSSCNESSFKAKRTFKKKIFTTFHKKYRQTLILNTFHQLLFCEFATEPVIKDMCDFSRTNIISLTILFSAVFKLFLWENFSQASLWSSYLYAEFMKALYRYNIWFDSSWSIIIRFPFPPLKRFGCFCDALFYFILYLLIHECKRCLTNKGIFFIFYW